MPDLHHYSWIKNVVYFCEFLIVSRLALVTYTEKPPNENKHKKDIYIAQSRSTKAFNGTVVNQALPYFHGGTLESTFLSR